MYDSIDMNTKAELLRSLHRPTLVLPNAWDAASARIFERAGFPALATTSAGVACALGYPDGELLTRAEMIAVVARIARMVKIPVTADVEAGYGDPVQTALAVWRAGAVGMNLEDFSGGRLHAIEDQVEAIRGIRATTPLMVINARTDIFLKAIGEEATRFDRAVERLNAFLEAGADCVFAPGVYDRDSILRVVKAVRGPLNILASKGVPPVAELRKIGVARLSVGSGPMRATLGLVDRMARELFDKGTWESILQGAIPYAEVNAMLRENDGKSA